MQLEIENRLSRDERAKRYMTLHNPALMDRRLQGISASALLLKEGPVFIFTPWVLKEKFSGGIYVIHCKALSSRADGKKGGSRGRCGREWQKERERKRRGRRAEGI